MAIELKPEIYSLYLCVFYITIYDSYVNFVVTNNLIVGLKALNFNN